MIGKIALLLFPLLMAFAASSDLLTMRISNKLIVVMVAAFPVLAVAVGMPMQEFAMHLTCAIIVLCVAFCFFAFGWIGGGDAKLAAATMLWLGFGLTLPYLLYSAVLGGALTLVLLLVRRWPLPLFVTRFSWVQRLHHPKTGIPYGIALAVAGLLVYSDTSIYQQLIG
ncbi:MAG TPA: prepilin peptidase [Devosiaceae bacterium]|jgi:prepilin peptidase CpaA